MVGDIEIMKKEKRIVLEMTVEQAQTLSRACETYARLCMGQMDVLRDVRKDCMLDHHNSTMIKSVVFPELSSGGYYGIHSEEIDDDARQLMDFHQVLRHHLSWRKEKNTPENRDWSNQMTVNFDDPMHLSTEQPLPIITEIEKEDIK
jgi:hypothetical protein